MKHVLQKLVCDWSIHLRNRYELHSGANISKEMAMGEILSILNVVVEMQQYMRVVPSTWNPNVAPNRDLPKAG